MITQKTSVDQSITRNGIYYSKRMLFAVMGLMTLLVMGYEVYYLYDASPGRARLLSMGWVLFPHIVFATTGFVVGPLQFSSRLRKQHLSLHRTLGKVYVFSILLGASFAIAISVAYPPKNGNFFFENLVQEAVWLLTTLIAWIAVRNRQIAWHKVWMARSYSVTFIFILSRVFAPLPFFQQMGIESATSYMWFLIVFSLIVPDLLVSGKTLLASPKRPDAPYAGLN